LSDESDVGTQAQKLSMAAFQLAQKVAAGGNGVAPEDREEANRLVAQVKEMQAATAAAAASTATALTDAKLDLDWIRSSCTLPTSTRLHWYLKESDRT
jgi:hypothetical protein